MSQHTEYVARIEKWCSRTGLKKSHARFNKVLPWLDPFSYPLEFDHIRVFYYPPRKLYILIAEPYESAPGSAATKAISLSKGEDFSVVECDIGAGLWSPGACSCTLIARAGESEVLESFAQELLLIDSF